MPATPEAKEVAELLKMSGLLGEADPQFPYGLIRKYFINGVANLLAIVGDCNCNGLLEKHMERMEALYGEFMTVLRVPHADAFAMLLEDFHDVVFKAGVRFLRTEGEDRGGEGCVRVCWGKEGEGYEGSFIPCSSSRVSTRFDSSALLLSSVLYTTAEATSHTA